MVVKHGSPEAFSSLCEQAQPLAEHLRPSGKTWVQILVPHQGAWTHFFFCSLVTFSGYTFPRL